MTNNSDKITISVMFLSLLLIFELIQQAALMNFMLFLNIFIFIFIFPLKNFILNILKEKLHVSCDVGSFFLKTI